MRVMVKKEFNDLCLSRKSPEVHSFLNPSEMIIIIQQYALSCIYIYLKYCITRGDYT